MAVANGSLRSAELLWSWGANAEKPDRDGNLPIHLATEKENVEMLQFLVIRAKVNIEAIRKDLKTSLQMACFDNLEQSCEALINLGADKNVQSGDGEARSPLHIATLKNHANIVKMLILNGAKVNLRNLNRETPMMLAVRHGTFETARMLAKQGNADVELYCNKGKRVIHHAIEGQSVPCLKLVAEDCNASLDFADDNKELPFHLAARLGNVDIGRILMAKQKDLVDQVNTEGETALHIAAKHGNFEFVKMLIEMGSSLSTIDRKGYTPLQTAEAELAKDSSYNALVALMKKQVDRAKTPNEADL